MIPKNEFYICQICGIEIPDSYWVYKLVEELENGGPDADPLEMEGDAKDLETQLKWLYDARLLCDPDDEFGQFLPDFQHETLEDDIEDPEFRETPEVRSRSQASDIEVHIGEADEEYKFWKPYPKHLPMTRVGMMYTSTYTTDGRVYAVVHAACLEIARKIFVSSELAHLAVNGYYLPDCNWGQRECPGMEWPGPYASPRANLFYSIGRNPFEIENLTECLLKNLQSCRTQVNFTADFAKVAKNLARMPGEIMNAIFANMGQNLPRLSSRLVAQMFWKEQLKAGSHGLLPWLWDIDAALIDDKDAQPCPEGDDFEWDWELLVRQLSRGVDYGVRPGLPEDTLPEPRWEEDSEKSTWDTICTGYHTDLVHVPAGLHNRRRIWQLLEEMFVGDALPWPRVTPFWETSYVHPPEKNFIPLWWNKSGEILSSPIWLPSINFASWDAPSGWYGGLTTFRRRLGGDIYVFRNKSNLQYWQINIDEKSRGKPTTGDAAKIRPATVEEIYAVLRPLGYPV
ncbi:uncharacterized protein CTRU02_202661 [Colletotrichum truncatum]|uniref:Uncharacterized protein n=1 Tax=Colletotrichum truncatum TaxID=5467 RepID=A0ACC3ZKV2_COLTU